MNYTVSGVGGVSPAALSINDPTTTEGGSLSFVVTQSGNTTGAVGVSYTTVNGSATSPGDFTATSGSLSFAANEVSKTIPVPTLDDAAVEGNETLGVNLSNPTNGAVLARTTGVGTIVDNDATPPSFAISNAAAVIEGASLAYTVTKTGATGGTYSVNFAAGGGTATAGSDYNPNSGTLSFSAAQTTQQISVVTIDDAVLESSESVVVTLSSPSGGATITTAQGSGAINDNEVNTPPVANADSVGLVQCRESFTDLVATANDTDPNGRLPLTVTAVSSAQISAEIISASTIRFYDPGGSGSFNATYTISNSAGATATGSITISVRSGACSRPAPGG